MVVNRNEGKPQKANPQIKRATDKSLTSKQRYKRKSFDAQFREFERWFSKGIFTMKQVSVKTDIDRANICRWISRKKKSNSIYLVRFGICPITKHAGVGFYTTNYNLYLQFKAIHNGK